LGHQKQVIHDQRAVCADGHGFLTFLELPPVQARIAMAKVNAPVLYEVTGLLRLGMTLEIRRRTHDSGTVILRYALRDHVLLDVLGQNGFLRRIRQRRYRGDYRP
jgi:hypothetical protein